MENVEKYLAELANMCWHLQKRKAENLFIGDYAPDIGKTPDLEQDIASCYQSLIGIIRWMVEISRVDIITEVPIMESHMAMSME